MTTAKYVEHWFTFPPKIREAATREGFKSVPSQIALRAHDGDDLLKALEACGPQGALGFRNRLTSMTICGVNFDPKGAKEGRKPCSVAAEDPNCIPHNVFAGLSGPMVTLLGKVFSQINEAEEKDVQDFLSSGSVVA